MNHLTDAAPEYSPVPAGPFEQAMYAANWTAVRDLANNVVYWINGNTGRQVTNLEASAYWKDTGETAVPF